MTKQERLNDFAADHDVLEAQINRLVKRMIMKYPEASFGICTTDFPIKLLAVIDLDKLQYDDTPTTD